ncbi:MAG: carboxyl transferase domain-containing protein [Dehalococcoidia bacterium]|nr:carboxyl transferase domain-containing protein [Dehalococcoidia bacterium]
MTEEGKHRLENLARQFGVPVEYVETVLGIREARTMQEKLDFFQKEQLGIELGNPQAVKQQHDKGKLTARERVDKLLDPGSFQELDLLRRPYECGYPGEETGRGDGVVTGFGTIDGRPVTVWSQDATVMGGTVGTVHARKIIRTMENALQSRTPIVGIFDSEGIRAHDAIQYPDFYSPGAMAYFQTLASGVIPKISLVMGPCTGEMALIANLSDFVFMVRNTSFMHLASPPPGIDGQTLGDAWKVQARVGPCDVLADTDEDCLAKCRQLVSLLPSNNLELPPRVDTGDDPNRREEELLEIVPINTAKPFSMYRLISLITDKGDFFEIKRHFAQNLITGFARFGGNPVGLLASNPQFKGGCMNIDAADKMSRFVRFCDAFNIPLIWLADSPAFLPAIEEERRGLIRHGSRMVMANSEATVPRITVSVRKHFGGGRLSFPGPFLGSDVSIAWPTVEPGLMSAEGAVGIMYRKELSAIEDETVRKERHNERLEEMRWCLDMLIRESNEKIIDPRDTRPFLIEALKWLRNRQDGSLTSKELPPRKHENFRM